MLKYFFNFFFFYTMSMQIIKKNNKNLKNTKNLNFEFEQNINGKIENGNCIIQYPKKIFVNMLKNNKILVSNGKSLVIKTNQVIIDIP